MSRRILIVDDDEDLRLVVRLALESAGGFEVMSCGTAGEALELIRSHRPGLVLLDVQLPDRSGPDILEELGAQALPPVVFLTARARPEDRRHYLELGALDVISKPFEPMKLAEQVRLIWQRFR